MSGIEVFGLLLGSFPLLISAAEHYKDGFEPLLKWKRFRKDFIAFIDAVDIEKQLFYQMLERFLISADVPHEELHLLMTCPEYTGWQSKRLVEALKGRLGASYDAYLSTLNTMGLLMAELETVLSLKNGKVDWADEGASRWDYQLKRIRLSFSKRGVRTLESLENHNRKLRELLDSSDKLESLKVTRKDTSWGTVFESIRKHAGSLHSAVKNSWKCSCVEPHEGDLQLECRNTGDWSCPFNMAFDIPNKSGTTAIQRREMTISLKKKKEYSPSRTSSPSLSIESSMTSTDHLRRNFEYKPSSQLTVATWSTLAPLVSGSSATSSQSSFRDMFSGGQSGQSTNTSVSCGSETEIVLEESVSRRWLSRSRKPKKSVRMQVPCVNPPIELSTTLQPVASSSIGIMSTPKIEIQSHSDGTSTAIEDLCSELRAETPFNGLRHLKYEDECCYEITCLQESQIASHQDSLITLDEMLQGQGGPTLSRRQRYKIACILASSVLQLQSTPWLSQKLGKRDVLFHKNGADDINLEHPYIRHTFNSTMISNSNPAAAINPVTASRFAARNSLSNLGIVLLELCFGQVIEKQEFRKCYLGPDGKAHDSTDYMTARDWAETVCEEDPALEHIIKCCVFCIFDEKADWESKKFIQAVYCSVVEPLEKINNKWAATS